MKILVVRRDNIGDLVCTTPLLAALKKAKPEGWIGALVNSYNAPVLDRNPDLDAVVAYRKLKHLAPGESALGALGERVASLWRLRQAKLDAVVLATPGQATRGLRLARWLAPKAIAGFDDGSPAARSLDLRVPRGDLERLHEVEHVFSLARLFGIDGPAPPLVLEPDPLAIAKARTALGGRPGRTIGIHISARRKSQRWPVERFVGLARALLERGARPVLLWSPGPADHPQHPGDDDKAARIAHLLGSGAIAYPTPQLRILIGMLAVCDAVICPDGGAMHLAAALQKPVVALFGDSPVERWRPWGVRHRVLVAPSRDVGDLGVEEVLAAYDAVVAPA
jgi:ADP-heptose:LPS heptosyltransferase